LVIEGNAVTELIEPFMHLVPEVAALMNDLDPAFRDAREPGYVLLARPAVDALALDENGRLWVGLHVMVQDRPVRVERRLAAILAADVAGYSRLMHHDEEATHAKLTTLLADGVAPAISEHGGRIVKNTGDGRLWAIPCEPRGALFQFTIPAD
jgi:hypothetical protein